MATGKGKKKQEVLNYKAQERTLREQGPGRLYLLWGREDYLREQYLLELKKLCLPGGEDDFSYHRFDGAELDFQALADAVDAVPFCPSARSSRCAALIRTSAARKMRRRSSRSSATCRITARWCSSWARTLSRTAA